MKQKKAVSISAKEKGVLRFLTNTIKDEGIKADVRFYDERGLRLAAFMSEGFFRDRIMISRGLLSELTEKESEAIGLHEIAHVKYGHSGKKVISGLYSITPFFIILLMVESISRSLGWSLPPLLSNVGTTLYIIFSFAWGVHFGFKRTQWTELQADSYAKRKIGSSRVVITALKKTIKYQWKQKRARKFWKIWNAVLSTHPAFRERVKNLKEDSVPAP